MQTDRAADSLTVSSEFGATADEWTMQGLPRRQPQATSPVNVAARLAAEAAFAPRPQVVQPGDGPRITVISKRARPGPDPAISDAPWPDESPVRASRVFRVGLAVPAVEEGAAEAVARAAVAAAGMRRRRRKGPEREPSPVRVFLASAQGLLVPADEQALRRESRVPERAPGNSVGADSGTDTASAGTAAERFHQLRHALRGLEPIFMGIRHAQAFRVDDDEVVQEWQRLSRLADEIAAELAAFSAGLANQAQV
jgi:hypothetical protein